MSFAQNVIVACWIVFVAFWAVAALRTKRTVHTQPLSLRLQHGVPVVIGVWLLLKGTSDPHPLGERLIAHTTAVVAVGAAVAFLGLLLALWARVVLGGNWSGQVTFKENHELVRRGPYAHVRHPIYSAILLMFVGNAISVGTWGALIGLPLILLGVQLKLRQEEALMREHFPDEYATYRAQVGALVPRLFGRPAGTAELARSSRL